MQKNKNELETRLNDLEYEYELAHTDLENEWKISELNFQIAGLLKKNNRYLLREYTDRLIARYNMDVGWYYQRGVEDGRACIRQACSQQTCDRQV